MNTDKMSREALLLLAQALEQDSKDAINRGDSLASAEARGKAVIVRNELKLRPS